ncbi:hypothetical protein WME89_33630 [Sorangium sp. So ce321]|uniref:hypothetical protein n=1 Tax=Sorangium sp. So ce321 TaxID=3133300 RepID=UPI003F5ED16B
MAIAEFFATQFIRREAAHRSGITGNVEWTRHLSEVVADIATANGFHVKTKAVHDEFGRAEYFTLDALCLEGAHPQHGADRIAFPLPAITLEFENRPDRILYDYWKLLCVRSRLRVLVLIVPSDSAEARHIAELTALRAEHASLDGEDLLLGGRNGMANKPDAVWTVHVWRSGGFQGIKLEEGQPWNRPVP